VLANGGAGGAGNASTNLGHGGGGGGSGGVIYLAAPVLDVQAGAQVRAVGGQGGSSTPAACGSGGAGGLGRIRISAHESTCTLAGTFEPALASGCAPSDVAERTYVATFPR
jgi:hypothetical protein